MGVQADKDRIAVALRTLLWPPQEPHKGEDHSPAASQPELRKALIPLLLKATHGIFLARAICPFRSLGLCLTQSRHPRTPLAHYLARDP